MKNKLLCIVIGIVIFVLVVIGIQAYRYDVTEDYQNILIGLSAILTPLLGVLGYKEWRSELHGKTKFGIARDAIKILDRLNEKIEKLRLEKVPDNLRYSEWLKQDKEIPEGLLAPWDRVFTDGIESIKSDMDQLYALRGDFRALFVEDTVKELIKLKKHVFNLECTASLYFGLPPLLKKPFREDVLTRLREEEDMLFSKEENDQYGKALADIVNSLVNLIKQETELKL